MNTTETTANERARFAREMTESVEDLRSLGIIDGPTYKRTMRDLNHEGADETIVAISGGDIRFMREQAHVSQAVLAKYLNLSVDHISKLERGALRPTGALLAMLNVIRRKGIDAIL